MGNYNLLSNMKIKTCLALLALCIVDTVETGTNADGSVNWQFYARAAGKFYIGAASGTQKDITMKDTNCYEYAVIFEDELVNQLFKNGIDFAVFLDRFQIAQVKL